MPNLNDEKTLIWREWLYTCCSLIKEGKRYLWFTNNNCHYIVDTKTEDIEMVYGRQGSLLFEEREGLNG